jgi:hypothetical protein
MAGSQQREAVGPLSFQQEEMLRRLRTFPECAPRYDGVHLFELDGALDLDCLAGALDDVVDRHETLRTTIDATATGDRQRVHASMSEPIAWSSGSADLAADLLDARYGTGEVLAGRPLFRAHVAPLGACRHALALTVHHLLCDGLSLFVLWRDLSECYGARLARRARCLPQLPVSYLEYARQQRERWDRCAATAVPFWRTVAAGAPREVAWPAPAVPGGPYDTAERTCSFEPDAIAAVRRTARAARVTPFLVLLAASTAAVARVVGADVLFGTDVAGREEPFKRDLVGHLLNTTMTRATPERPPSLRQLVLRVREAWLTAEEQQQAYLDGVLQHLGIAWLPSVLLDQDDLAVNPQFPGVSVTRVAVQRLDPYWREFLLSWRIMPDRCVAGVLYRQSCVDAGTVDAILREIGELLRLPE